MRFEAEMNQFPLADFEARSGRSGSDHHFLHTNVLMRHASAQSGAAGEHIDSILTRAAVTRRPIWVSSILFAKLRPSMFAPKGFATLDDFIRHIRSLATVVTPDPNAMLRVARLCDAKWRRPAGIRAADEAPRTLSLFDAIEIASALWVKEAAGVADLTFLMFDDWSSTEARGAGRLSLLRLQDYAEDARVNSDVMAAVRLTRVEPVLKAQPVPQSEPA